MSVWIFKYDRITQKEANKMYANSQSNRLTNQHKDSLGVVGE